MRIGIDVDGVLANFNERFVERITQVTGRDLFPPRPVEPPCWNYPQHFGYTHAEVAETWHTIEGDTTFWFLLLPYAGAREALKALNYRHPADDLYFITSRPGRQAKAQTEAWLSAHGFDRPSVLISGHKGLCAEALHLDVYLDDRYENALSVATTRTASYLLDRPWNQQHREASTPGITVVPTLHAFLDAL